MLAYLLRNVSRDAFIATALVSLTSALMHLGN